MAERFVNGYGVPSVGDTSWTYFGGPGGTVDSLCSQTVPSGTANTPGALCQDGSGNFSYGFPANVSQTIATASSTTTFTKSTVQYTIFTGTQAQTCVLPAATTLPLGQTYEIDNASTLAVTLQTNGGATLWTIASGTDVRILLTNNTTAAGTWNIDYYGQISATGKGQSFTDNLIVATNKPGMPLNDGSGNISFGPSISVNALEVFGHSFFNKASGLGPAIGNGNVNQSSVCTNLLTGVLALNTERVRNHAVDGAKLTTVGKTGGGFAKALAEITRSRQTYPFARSGGMYIMGWGINDIGNNTVANQSLMNSTYNNCLTAIISKARSAAIYLANGGANWTFGGNFSAAASTTYEWSSGAVMHATVVDSAGTSTATFTIPFGYKGEPICFGLIGTQGAATGCIVTWGGTVTGTSGIIGTTTNLNSVSLDTNSIVPVRFTSSANGLSASNAGQTITVRVTTISGGDFGLDGCWIEALHPDPIIICNTAKCACHTIPYAFGDGVTSGVNTSFVSATAQFLAATDTGAVLTETDAQGAISGLTVGSVTNPTTIVLSGNATGSFSNIKYTIARIVNGYSSTQGGYYSTNTDFANATPTSHSAADADVTTLNSTISTVVAGFDSMVQIADLNTALGNGDTTLASGIYSYMETTGLHPNDYGNSKVVQEIINAMTKLKPTDPLSYGAMDNVCSPAYMAGPSRRIIRSGQVYMPEFPAYGTTYTAVAGDMFAVPLFLTETTLNLTTIYLEQLNAPSTAGSNVYTGLYDDINMLGYPQCLIRQIPTGSAFAMGTSIAVVSPGSFGRTVNYGLFWLVLKIDSLGTNASQFRTIIGPSQYMPNWATTGGALTNIAWKVTGLSSGALPTTFPTGGVVSSSAPCIGVVLNVL